METTPLGKPCYKKRLGRTRVKISLRQLEPIVFLHTLNKQYLDKLRVVKAPCVLVCTSSSGHWMIAYWLFNLIKSCTLWCIYDPWPIYSSMCQHQPKLISSVQATVIRQSKRSKKKNMNTCRRITLWPLNKSILISSQKITIFDLYLTFDP